MTKANASLADSYRSEYDMDDRGVSQIVFLDGGLGQGVSKPPRHDDGTISRHARARDVLFESALGDREFPLNEIPRLGIDPCGGGETLERIKPHESDLLPEFAPFHNIPRRVPSVQGRCILEGSLHRVKCGGERGAGVHAELEVVPHHLLGRDEPCGLVDDGILGRHRRVQEE